MASSAKVQRVIARFARRLHPDMIEVRRIVATELAARLPASVARLPPADVEAVVEALWRARDEGFTTGCSLHEPDERLASAAVDFLDFVERFAPRLSQPVRRAVDKLRAAS